MPMSSMPTRSPTQHAQAAPVGRDPQPAVDPDFTTVVPLPQLKSQLEQQPSQRPHPVFIIATRARGRQADGAGGGGSDKEGLPQVLGNRFKSRRRFGCRQCNCAGNTALMGRGGREGGGREGGGREGGGRREEGGRWRARSPPAGQRQT
eukprot:761038-Hanusia_phi.AAC.1